MSAGEPCFYVGGYVTSKLETQKRKCSTATLIIISPTLTFILRFSSGPSPKLTIYTTN